MVVVDASAVVSLLLRDALYLDLALRLKARLLTEDRALARAAERLDIAAERP